MRRSLLVVLVGCCMIALLALALGLSWAAAQRSVHPAVDAAGVVSHFQASQIPIDRVTVPQTLPQPGPGSTDTYTSLANFRDLSAATPVNSPVNASVEVFASAQGASTRIQAIPSYYESNAIFHEVDVQHGVIVVRLFGDHFAPAEIAAYQQALATL